MASEDSRLWLLSRGCAHEERSIAQKKQRSAETVGQSDRGPGGCSAARDAATGRVWLDAARGRPAVAVSGIEPVASGGWNQLGEGAAMVRPEPTAAGR